MPDLDKRVTTITVLAASVPGLVLLAIASLLPSGGGVTGRAGSAILILKSVLICMTCVFAGALIAKGGRPSSAIVRNVISVFVGGAVATFGAIATDTLFGG